MTFKRAEKKHILSLRNAFFVIFPLPGIFFFLEQETIFVLRNQQYPLTEQKHFSTWKKRKFFFIYFLICDKRQEEKTRNISNSFENGISRGAGMRWHERIIGWKNKSDGYVTHARSPENPSHDKIAQKNLKFARNSKTSEIVKRGIKLKLSKFSQFPFTRKGKSSVVYK